MDYQDEVTAKLARLLREIPSKADQQAEMDECEAAANGYLTGSVRRDNPLVFSEDLAQALRPLIDKDKDRLAMSAEIPRELVQNLLPSDGHLDN